MTGPRPTPNPQSQAAKISYLATWASGVAAVTAHEAWVSTNAPFLAQRATAAAAQAAAQAARSAASARDSSAIVQYAAEKSLAKRVESNKLVRMYKAKMAAAKLAAKERERQQRAAKHGRKHLSVSDIMAGVQHEDDASEGWGE